MTHVTSDPVTAEQIEGAAKRIAGRVRETAVLPSGELSRRLGAPVVLKAENLQLTGSFKVRGASAKLALLSPQERAAGVAAGSAGNHAQALAFAARAAGVRAELYMPAQAPLSKVAAVRQYGGDVRLVEGSFDEANQVARRNATEHGMTFVHAFDDADVVAGQGTAGLEVARQVPDVGMVVVPLGGGGLAAGVAIALKSSRPDVRVIGVQAADCAPYLASLAAHRPIGARSASTICDGIAVKRPGDLTLPLVEHWLDGIVTVPDDSVAQAMVLLLERSKLVVEGAGAVGVAALLDGKIEPPPSGSVCVLLSGGNVDASLLQECIRLGETAAGRRMVIRTLVPDRPGALAGLLRIVAEQGANVLDVDHIREGVDLHIRETEIHLVLQTGGREQGATVLEAIRREGFAVQLVL
jgi:threonine dehydratase